jgi:hypothetical protein
MDAMKHFKNFTLGTVVEFVARCHIIELVRKAAGDQFPESVQRRVMDQIKAGVGNMDLDEVVRLGNVLKKDFELPDSVYDDADVLEVREALLHHSRPTPGLVVIQGQPYAITPSLSVDYPGDTFNV